MQIFRFRLAAVGNHKNGSRKTGWLCFRTEDLVSEVESNK